MQGWIFLTMMTMGSLFAITGLRQFFIEPLASTGTNIVWFAIQVAPLLIIIPGLLKHSPNTYLYGILVAMLYFVHGVMVAATEPLRWFGITEVAFALAMALVCTVVLRRLRAQSGQ